MAENLSRQAGAELAGLDQAIIMKLLWPHSWIFRSANSGLAHNALVDPSSALHIASIQEKRFLALRKAIWAKPMRGFGAACIWLQNKSHSPLAPDALKFIALLLSVPCFEISHFCFKRAYAVSLLRIRLAGLDSLFESVQNDSLKVNGFGAKRLVAQTYHCLRDIERRANASNGSGNFPCGHAKVSP